MTATSHPLLRVENLHIDIHTATHTKHVVRAVDFTLERGKTLCIVGESGCGKSLTALALLDLLPAAARRRMTRLEFAGQDLSTLTPRQLAELRGARIAMIFQDPMTSLNPVFQIGTQLIDVMRRHKRVSRRQPPSARNTCCAGSASPTRKNACASIRLSCRAGCASA